MSETVRIGLGLDYAHVRWLLGLFVKKYKLERVYELLHKGSCLCPLDQQVIVE